MISIAIADDEEKIRLGLSGVLTQNLTGVEIAASFESGGALMDYLQTHDVDILITDIEMSGASGLQVLEFLRRSHRGTRVVMITAFQRFDYAMGALENHVDAFLTKPFSTQKLLDTVRALIGAIQQEADSRSGREVNVREMLRLMCRAERDLPERLFLLGETRPLDRTRLRAERRNRRHAVSIAAAVSALPALCPRAIGARTADAGGQSPRGAGAAARVRSEPVRR